jgi:hypothetical protein
MCLLPPTRARGGAGTLLAHILHKKVCDRRALWAGAATLSVGRNHAISTGRRCITRAARQSARLVSAGKAGVQLGRGTAPAERARQIAVWGGDTGGRKPAAKSASSREFGRRSLLAGWSSPGQIGLPASDSRTSLARCPASTRPPSVGRGTGGLFRPRRLSCRMRSVSSNGRYADPLHPPFRTVLTPPKEIYWLAVVRVASRQPPSYQSSLIGRGSLLARLSPISHSQGYRGSLVIAN